MATEIAQAKITLYWLNKSRSQRILWLLEETGQDYNVEIFKRSSEMRAPPELKKVHPLGKSPIVGIQAPGVTEPIILAESGLITEYLAEHFAKHLVPTRYTDGKEGPGLETTQWLRYRYLMHFAEGTLMALMVSNLLFDLLKNGPIPFFVKPLTRMIATQFDKVYFGPEYKANFSMLENMLATSPEGGQFLCGKTLTASDILMHFPLSAARDRGILDKSIYPKLFAYIELLESQEGWKRSVKKAEEKTGEPYVLF